MEIPNKHGELAEYLLPGGDRILYHPTKTFPPGSGSADLAFLAQCKISKVTKDSIGQSSPINILDIDTGVGTFLTSLFPYIHDINSTLVGIDNDPLSVGLAKINLEELQIKHQTEKVEIDIRMADSTQNDALCSFQNNSFHLIYFNPPFYSPGYILPSKLSATPRGMSTTEDPDGLYHYNKVLPQLPRILSQQKGSCIIARLPDYDLFDNKDFVQMIGNMVKNITAQVQVWGEYYVTESGVKRYLIVDVV